MKQPSYEKVVDVFFKIFYLAFISILWVVFCIPIFTAGASTTAMYYTVQKCVRHDRGRIWDSFWSSFKSNFKQASIISLILLGIIVFLVFEILYIQALERDGFNIGRYDIVLEVLIMLLCIYAFWIFSHIARFEGTILMHLKNSFLFAILHLHITVAVTIIGIGALILIQAFFPLIVLVPGCSVFVMSIFTERVFRKYMSEEDKEKEDKINMEDKNDYVGKFWDERKQKKIHD